nr:MAG TPA: hypothetical protein [Caudoviricetes sp.]
MRDFISFTFTPLGAIGLTFSRKIRLYHYPYG